MNKEILELRKKLPPINVLNPIIPENKIKEIAELTEFGIDYRHLLDVAAALVLTDLLFDGNKLNTEQYYKCKELAKKAGNFLAQECTEDWQRLLSVTFLTKGMVKSLIDITNFNMNKSIGLPNKTKQSCTINIFLPSINIETVKIMSEFCCSKNITAIEMLDIGLAWINMDKLTAYESITRETLYLDYQRLKESAEVGKMINRLFRSQESDSENIIIANLIILKVCITNLLGKCANVSNF